MAAKKRGKMSPVRLGAVSGLTHEHNISPIDGQPITAEPQYVPLKDRFTVHPVTIWPLPMDRWQRALRDLVGDTGQLRADSFMGGSWLPTERKGGNRYGDDRAAASIFNPLLAGTLVQAYTVPGNLVHDPFAGGGTRAVITGCMEREYLGIDIRPDEVQRVSARIEELGLPGVSVLEGDAATYAWGACMTPDGARYVRRADALITCPPYWNLEIYSDDPNDLSTKPTYEAFLGGIEQVVERSRSGLKNGAIAAWVCGEFRHPETGELIDFPGDVARLHQKHGFWIYDRFVYTHANPQAFWRMGVFEKTRKLIRVHEHVIVAKYGGLVKARRHARATGADYLGGD